MNLLDCSVMYTFGNNDEFSLRGNLSYFDSSALVDAATDTLIYPGENGILYLIKLNTSYAPEAGTLSINPDHIVKWRYYGTRTSVGSYWLGMEDSAAIYDGYLFIADNGGNLMCLDLNTLQLVMGSRMFWMTPTPLLFCLWRTDTFICMSAPLSVWAGEAAPLQRFLSGKLMRRQERSSGRPLTTVPPRTVFQAVYSLPSLLEKKNCRITFMLTVARTGGQAQGVLACIDKNTGKVNWEHESAYAWSSPVCVYNPDGSGKVLYCNSTGHIYLLDGKTGDVLDCHQISEGVIEASPAVYQSYMVVGTRDCEIWGMELQ
ncbi:MAG: PQQ-binding-like beta-propeller repeat protein [Ruminococcus sp.]